MTTSDISRDFNYERINHILHLRNSPVLFAFIMTIILNIAAAFLDPEIHIDYSKIRELRLLSILFPLGVIIWVMLTPGISNVACALLKRCKDSEHGIGLNNSNHGRLLIFFGIISLVILSLYLSEVSIWNTGLVVILFGSSQLDPSMARELSLKLINNSVLTYSYSLYTSVLAPLQGAIAVLVTPRSWRLRVAIYCYCLILLVTVGLTGARWQPGYFILVIAIAFFLRRSSVKLLGVLVVGIGFVVSFAAALSILREGRLHDFSPGLLGEYMWIIISHRIVGLPFETGVWTNLYMDRYQLPLGSTIRPLAWILGTDYINLPNLVGLEFYPGAGATISCGTCFVYDFQAAFGLYVGWLIAILYLIILDVGLLAFRRLDPIPLCAFLAVFMASTIALSSSAYTVSLVTHGMLLVIFLAYATSLLLRSRFVQQWD